MIETVKPATSPCHSAMRPSMLESGVNRRRQVAAVTVFADLRPRRRRHSRPKGAAKPPRRQAAGRE